MSECCDTCDDAHCLLSCDHVGSSLLTVHVLDTNSIQLRGIVSLNGFSDCDRGWIARDVHSVVATNLLLEVKTNTSGTQVALVDWLHRRCGDTLTSLELIDCTFDDAFAVSFSKRHWPHLELLDLKNNRVSDAGGVALTHISTFAPSLLSLDLSNNRLSSTVLLQMADQLDGSLRSLKHLRLSDLQHLLPVRVFQKFATKMETNYCLNELTLGYEIINGKPNDTPKQTTPKECKEMDAMLRYWWQEPSFRCATNRIQFLLRLNYGVAESVTIYDPINKLRWILALFDCSQEQEVLYLLFQAKPSLLKEMLAHGQGFQNKNDGEASL